MSTYDDLKDKEKKEKKHKKDKKDSKDKDKEKEKEKETPQLDPAELLSGEVKKISLKSTECPVELLTVYKDRAEVVRKVKTTLPERGVYDISVEGLSNDLDKNSVHVSGGTGAAAILEVSCHTVYEAPEVLSSAEVQKKIELRKELAASRDELSRTRDLTTKNIVWVEEWAKNVQSTPQTHAKNVPEKGGFLSPDYLNNVKSFLEFYHSQLNTLTKEKVDLDFKISDLDSRILALSEEIGNNNIKATQVNKLEHMRSSVVISLAGQGDIALQLAYVVNRASWTPSYDCRVSSDNSNIQLTYYANISNSTTEDWIDAHLFLSTAAPESGGSPPDLGTARVGVRVPRSYPVATRARRMSACRDEMVCCQTAAFAISEECEDSRPAPQPIATLVTKATESLASATFEIPRKATINSDGKEHKVTVAIISLDTRFTYTVVPRCSPHSYLKSTTTNTSNYFILEGTCNVFMDNNFVATSQLKDVAPNEEFAFFLGTDKGVKVEYKPPSEVKDQSGYIRKSNLQTWTSLVTVKNTKSKTIAVVVYEQLPASSDERIKVTLMDPDLKAKDCKAKLNSSNNLEWRYRIEAGQTLNVPCKYAVESPTALDIEYT